MSFSNVVNALKAGGVIPRFLKESFAPTKLLTMSYNSKPVEIGSVLTPSQVQDQPTVQYEADANEYFTLIFCDPDAPSRNDPKFSPWLHWIVTNIPGNKITEGEVMAGYIGSGPPPKTGLHRYCLFVCQQPKGKTTFSGEYILPVSAEKRNNWEFEQFVQKWNLDIKGATFFEAEFDDSVPKLYEKLGSCKEQPKLIN